MSQLTIQQAIEFGRGHHQAGRVDVAESVYRQILAQQPDQPDALHLLGVIASSSGQHLLAVDLISRAIGRNPRNATYHSNLGQVLTTLGRFDDATQSLQAALSLNPNLPEAQNNLGHLLMLQSRFESAIEHLRRAIALEPAYVQAHANLASALEKQVDLDGAIEHYRTIISLKPDYAEAYNNLANVLGSVAKLDEAIECLRHAIALRPDLVTAHSNLIYLIHFHQDYGPQRIFEERRQWNLRHAEPLKASILPHSNDPDPNRKLRIGHLSPEFRTHCLSFFSIPLLSNHNHEEFEIHCYADVAKPDSTTERIKSYADAWHENAGLSDEQVAAMIRADQIDILIDHSMHMNNGRPLLMARKPAPVQVAWLAYPGSTGMTAVDYRLTDPQLDPPGLGDQFYSETSIRLPHAFWCYDPLTNEPQVNAPPVESHGFITFGCLNNFIKLNEATLQIWAEVLRNVPNSRLILLAPPGTCRDWILGFIPAERIEFVSYKPRAEYLEIYHRIDIALDTMPYNGHTTSFDALWMGVPIVTLAGRTCVARGGLSLLSNLGLTDLAAKNVQEYVQIARTLAADRTRLTDLRCSLRHRMETSPLMDGPRFASDFEAALRGMWRTWCKSRNLQSNLQ